MKILDRLFIGFTLFVSGAGIMILEILGTRLISPFFGVGLYIWTSLITVTLLSLSVGYGLGGFLADRVSRSSCLYSILFAAGLVTAFIPFLTPFVLSWTESWELRLGTLSATFLLFSVPLCGLGMISPLAMKLEAERFERVGRTAGILYAVSTVGSLSGSVLAGFVLIPIFPVARIFYLLAALLIGTAMGGLVISKGHRAIFILSLLASLALVFLFTRPAKAGAAGVIYRSEGFYGEIKVVDHEGYRSLLVNGSPQNFTPIPPSYKLFDQSPYTVYLASVLIYRPGIKKMLMIGLGGGTLPMIFSRYGVDTDVIEIDPQMERIARRFFGYQPGDGRVIIGDGRYRMRRLRESYDAVILDAFASFEHPSHLFTREMFREVREVLTEDGILAVNTAGFVEGPEARASKAILRTLEEAFPYVDAYHMEGKERVGNIIYVASPKPLELSGEPRQLDPADHGNLMMLLRAYPARELLQGGMVLTDSYNPLPYWGVPVHKAWREEVIKFFGKKVLRPL